MTNSNEDKKGDFSPLYRIIDANFNRFKEAIRVLEDVNRYVFNDKEISTELKKIRHSVVFNRKFSEELLKSRDIENDVLKKSIKAENIRNELKDILVANYRRGEESSRVLEEIFKLVDRNLSEKFKENRYLLYSLEKNNLLKNGKE